MKTTLNTLFDAHPALEFLAKQYFSVAHIAQVGRLYDEVNKHFAEIAKKQEELLSFYGTKGENGWDVPDDKKPFYEKDIEEYLSAEVELDWEPISIEELGLTVRLPLSAYKAISFLFTEEVPQTVE
jgi:hypothetical protein